MGLSAEIYIESVNCFFVLVLNLVNPRFLLKTQLTDSRYIWADYGPSLVVTLSIETKKEFVSLLDNNER
jgi:hypothetical protein